ncbi:MAG: lipopolysaccharide heptosyltransferase I [Acidobacteria bacterium]|nr:lipopolysaccharide heptosyltransferase I [Acidobacteriota bacterium]MBI3654943.1 lipopolysaccharide heptosyltransferase I [Acidobacteriota bacterium]
MERILILKLGSIGDIVHTLPAVAALRRRYPQARLDWVVETRAKTILENCPVVDALIEIDTRRWRRRPFAYTTIHECTDLMRGLRRARYDVAIDFQGLMKSATLAFISGAEVRVGFAGTHLREAAAQFLYTQKVTPGPAQHTHIITQNNALVQSLGVPVEEWTFPIAVTAEDEAYVEGQLQKLGVTRYAIINPGGGWVNKLWPAERYGQLASRLWTDCGLKTVVTAGPAEGELVYRVLRQAPSQSTVFLPTTIKQLVPLAKRASFFIGGDTGPLHIAAAVGTPIIGLYGPTLPARNGPFGVSDKVICRTELTCLGCYKRTCPLGTTACMDIEVDAVMAIIVNQAARLKP